MTIINKLSSILIVVLIINSLNVVSFASSSSEQLVVISRALLGEIDYKAEWLDTNKDNAFDVKDLIRAKKYFAGKTDDFKNIKSVKVSFVVGNETEIHEYFTPKIVLIDSKSPYKYWKKDNEFYSPLATLYIYSDAIFKATTHNPTIELPYV